MVLRNTRNALFRQRTKGAIAENSEGNYKNTEGKSNNLNAALVLGQPHFKGL
jgi:hypothetical protein